MNVNVNLMKKNVIQIKSGKMINVDVSVKSKIYLKKIIFEILLNVPVKMEVSFSKFHWPFSNYVGWNYRRNISKKF